MLKSETGTGTYDDPISFATATDNTKLPQCGIVYVPELRKYFRNEDDCAECREWLSYFFRLSGTFSPLMAW